MQKNAYILLLGANQFQRERALIGAEMVCPTNVITVSADAPFIKNKYSAITLKSQEAHPETLLQDIIQFTSYRNITLAAVIPLNDFVLDAGLAVAQHFNLPYNNHDVIERCRKKDIMKNTLAQANLPVAQSLRFHTYQEAAKLAEKIGYPLVIKPLNFGGSGGVKKINNVDELASGITETQHLLAQYAHHYNTDSERMLLEPYLSLNREISVEVINTPTFRQVIGITEKYLSEEPYFSEIGHAVPSTLMYEKERAISIRQLALDACAALQIQFGMAHVEIKLSRENNTAVIIEVGARTAGDGIMDLYEKTTGVNLYKLHCQSYLGSLTSEDIPKEFTRAAAIGYLHPKVGVIENIQRENITTEIQKNIDAIVIKAEPGDKIFTAKNWSTRYGFVEYIFENKFPENFNVIEKTSHITNKLFKIRKEQ